jgi:hypothetical protein
MKRFKEWNWRLVFWRVVVPLAVFLLVRAIRHDQRRTITDERRISDIQFVDSKRKILLIGQGSARLYDVATHKQLKSLSVGGFSLSGLYTSANFEIRPTFLKGERFICWGSNSALSVVNSLDLTEKMIPWPQADYPPDYPSTGGNREQEKNRKQDANLSGVVTNHKAAANQAVPQNHSSRYMNFSRLWERFRLMDANLSWPLQRARNGVGVTMQARMFFSVMTSQMENYYGIMRWRL